jgi:hypothetical protein
VFFLRYGLNCSNLDVLQLQRVKEQSAEDSKILGPKREEEDGGNCIMMSSLLSYNAYKSSVGKL